MQKPPNRHQSALEERGQNHALTERGTNPTLPSRFTHRPLRGARALSRPILPSMKKKPTAPHALISSEPGLIAAINRYVEARLDLTRRQARQEKRLAALKAEFARENAPFEVEALSLETGIQLYCTTHRTELFPDESQAKSRTYGNATVGFRLNPHSVSKVVGKDTWERIAGRLEGLPWGRPFVEITRSVARAELLKHRADFNDQQLAAAGLKFEQGETFFLEPQSALLDAARKPVESEVAA